MKAFKICNITSNFIYLFYFKLIRSINLQTLIQQSSEKMKFTSTTLFVVLVFILFQLNQCKPSLKCLAYLLELKTFYSTNKGLFFEQIAPYMLFSGKQLDDMGFPKLCKDKGYSYTTVKIEAYLTDQHVTEHSDFLYNFYYGFCFSNVCSLSDLNEDGKFLIDRIFQDEAVKINSISFYSVNLDADISTMSILIIISIIIWYFITMSGLFSKWFQQCHTLTTSTAEIQISIPLQQKNNQTQQQIQIYEQPIDNKFLKYISIGRKWNQIWREEQTSKIKQFSYYKIVSVPLIIYGYYFYLCNQGSFNIFAFNTQIYKAFYSNVATFAYYIPDVFFFISGYLFTKKVFTQVQTAQNKYMFVAKCFLSKLLRLYPIYLVALLIYSVITPSLHGGPMWNIHKENVQICQKVWWRNILMIDNFFTEGCFEFSWWVQAEIQFTLLAVLTFCLLFVKKSIGSILLYVQLLISWVLLFVLSQRLPVELQITVSSSSEHYFKSFHSHLPFYLTGVTLALLFKKQSARRLVIKFYFKNIFLFVIGLGLGAVSIFLVILRPIIFSYELLGFELSLCRLGVLFSFIIYCLPGFVKEKVHKSTIHKIAQLTYPIILISGIIVSASYWGLQTFPYTSGQSIIYSLFPNLFLSFFVGLFLHLLFNFKSNPNLKSI